MEEKKKFISNELWLQIGKSLVVFGALEAYFILAIGTFLQPSLVQGLSICLMGITLITAHKLIFKKSKKDGEASEEEQSSQ